MIRAAPPALLVLALLSPACGSGGGALPGVGEPASVIVVLIDTLRADHVGWHGHERDTTPFLDELARSSIVFGTAYSPASWTRASVASLFTGRIPESHGCENRDGALSPSVVTLAEVFAQHGWQTRGVVANGNVLPRHGFDQGFESYEFIRDFPDYPYADALVMSDPVAACLDALREGPAFVYLHYVDPHDPYTPHRDADFAPGYEGPMDGSVAALEGWRFQRPPEPEARRAVDLYDGEILWFDRRLSELFADLEERGLLAASWVVVTSDHGEGLWDHGVQSHGADVFQEQIRVPLIVRPPGGLPGGHRWVDEPISLVDVAPTLLELVGLPAPDGIEGRSWAGFLAGAADAPARPIVVDEDLENVELAAIVDGHDKLIVDLKRNQRLLYDLRSNPSEDPARALDLSRQRSATGEKLMRELDRVLTQARANRPSDNEYLESDPEQLEMLRQLGYLGEDGSAPAGGKAAGGDAPGAASPPTGEPSQGGGGRHEGGDGRRDDAR